MVGGSGGLVMFMKSGAFGINETASFEITVKAKADLSDGTVLRNKGRISSSTIEVNASNNTASAPVRVNGLADLRLTKSAGPASVNVGQNVSFTLVLTNDGPNAATGVTVRDQLPAGLTFQSAAPAADYDEHSGLWTIGTLASGTTRSLVVTARVDQAGPITNVAQVASSDQPDPHSGSGQRRRRPVRRRRSSGDYYRRSSRSELDKNRQQRGDSGRPERDVYPDAFQQRSECGNGRRGHR